MPTNRINPWLKGITDYHAIRDGKSLSSLLHDVQKANPDLNHAEQEQVKRAIQKINRNPKAVSSLSSTTKKALSAYGKAGFLQSKFTGNRPAAVSHIRALFEKARKVSVAERAEKKQERRQVGSYHRDHDEVDATTSIARRTVGGVTPVTGKWDDSLYADNNGNRQKPTTSVKHLDIS